MEKLIFSWNKNPIVWTPLPLFLEGGLTLPKILRKGGWKNCWTVVGILRKGDFVGKGGMLLVWVFFLAGMWQI